MIDHYTLEMTGNILKYYFQCIRDVTLALRLLHPWQVGARQCRHEHGRPVGPVAAGGGRFVRPSRAAGRLRPSDLLHEPTPHPPLLL